MAEYIATIPQDRFDMYTRIEFGEYNQHKCDSVGDIIGHCTILDDWDNIPKDEFGQIDFGDWSEKFTGLKCSSDEWLWCFAESWWWTDNTPIGASKRIMWLLEKGFPKDWEEQLLGESKLCYL